MSQRTCALAVRFCLLVALSCCAPLAQSEYKATVIAITDGDTIRVLKERSRIRIRLWGIDCPESRQAFGSRAKQFTGSLVFGKTVVIRVRDVDRHGRQVADVFLPDGRNLSQEIVRAGLGWWYVRYAPKDSKLRKLEGEARSAQRGLWAEKDAIPPWAWRRR